MRQHLEHGALLILAIAFLFGGLYELFHHTKKQILSINSPVLGAGVVEKLIVDSRAHTITTVSRKGGDVITTHVDNSRRTSISVNKEGEVKIETQTYGTEISPFIGFAYSDQARLAVGVSLLYVGRWETGLMLLPTMSGPFSIKGGLGVSYNVWSNTSLFVGVDNTKQPVGGFAVRF